MIRRKKMSKEKNLKLAIVLSIIGVIISLSFLISNFISDYSLVTPFCILLANVLILVGNYMRYHKYVLDK
jgi:uncharacterized protein (DUF983 family)